MTNGNKDTAEKLAAAAALASEPKKEKKLPALAQPTVSLPDEIRQIIAIYCRDANESFSTLSAKMWLTKLIAEKKVKADLVVDFSKKAGGMAGMKDKLDKKDATIEDLQRQLAEAKAAKK